MTMSETDTDQLENTKNQEDEEFDLDAFTDDDDESSRILIRMKLTPY